MNATHQPQVTDAEADAANIAYHEFTWGPEFHLTPRDLSIMRQAMKVAIAAARDAREQAES